MGTPRKSPHRVLFKPVSVFELIEILNLGKVSSLRLDVDCLTKVFTVVSDLFHPLVEWLDTPLSQSKHSRGLVLYRGWRNGFVDIAIERSGMWLVGGGEKCKYKLMQSADLAEFMFKKSEDLMKTAFSRKSDSFKAFVKINKFMQKPAFWYSVLWLLSEFFGTVDAQIKERQERLDRIKKRLAVFQEFTESLDPLKMRPEPLLCTEYSIWSGGHRYTGGDYLSLSALDETWSVVRQRHPNGGFRNETFKVQLCSMAEFVDRVSYLVDDIENARRYGHCDAASLVGVNSGRLPFTAEEIEVLRKMVEQIGIG